MVYCGIWDWCIMVFVKLVYCSHTKDSERQDAKPEALMLSHWPLWYVEVILEAYFSNSFYDLMYWALWKFLEVSATKFLRWQIDICLGNAWFCQATGHYMSLWWPRLSYLRGVTVSQCVKKLFLSLKIEMVTTAMFWQMDRKVCFQLSKYLSRYWTIGMLVCWQRKLHWFPLYQADLLAKINWRRLSLKLLKRGPIWDNVVWGTLSSAIGWYIAGLSLPRSSPLGQNGCQFGKRQF